MRSLRRLLGAIVIAQGLHQSSATLFRYDNDLQCSYPADVTTYMAKCNGGLCAFGDTIDVIGAVTLLENLPSYEMCVETKVCLLGIGFVCKTYKRDYVNVCHALGVSSQADGTACPNAGSFYFNSKVTLPGTGETNLGSGWWFSAEMTFRDCNPYKDYQIICTASFVAESSKTYQRPYTEYTAASAAVVAVVAALYVRMRRMARPTEGDDDSTDGNFELLPDGSVRA